MTPSHHINPQCRARRIFIFFTHTKYFFFLLLNNDCVRSFLLLPKYIYKKQCNHFFSGEQWLTLNYYWLMGRTKDIIRLGIKKKSNLYAVLLQRLAEYGNLIKKEKEDKFLGRNSQNWKLIAFVPTEWNISIIQSVPLRYASFQERKNAHLDSRVVLLRAYLHMYKY